MTELSIWNIWLDEHQSERSYKPERYEIAKHGGPGGGMLVEETADGVLLRCSGSYDGPDVHDLSARLSFHNRS